MGQFQNADIAFQRFGAFCRECGKLPQPRSNILLCAEQIWQVNIFRSVKGAGAHFVMLQQALQPGLYSIRLHPNKARSAFDQLICGQAGVAVVGVVAQSVQKPGGNAKVAALSYLQLGGDTIDLAEFQVQRLPAQHVGVLFQCFYRGGAKRAVGCNSHLGGKPKLGHPGNHFPHTVHTSELVGDGGGLLRGDTF